MDQKMVQQVTNNALSSKTIFADFLASQKDATTFVKHFHLRPTSTGITIVSTLPYAPMRGITVKCSELAATLGDLAKNFDKLLGEDEQSAKEKLRELGFKERQSAGANGEREEDIQAAFIRGMIEGQVAYEDIHFLASELNLEDENRFDVVGVKGNYLFLFELKNGRTTKVFKQVERYVAHVNQNLAAFTTLLQNYPIVDTSVSQIDAVKGIAVMRYAKNSPDAKWEPLVKMHQADAWFFEQAISFHKLTK